ncbi:betaine--homocysteine S-methyltransferase 1-like [Haliotis rufescens]|uniref:betaine--homocysteine S-methyltransferase 1-like n=1 Tax=Haliotis rufescens TaxID=6454 RepID=UPI00201FAD27|nr:betaine--homocysteine S-methyltransferase 1-like [Haliotis rufescens]
MPKKGLLERLQNGGNVIMAEGFVFEFERRGYLRAGPFVPEVVLDYPHLVRSLSEEFVHAGSEVVLAFTYYGHREKLRLIGKEHLLETLNKDALKIAKEVADESGTLMAGNICNTTVYRSNSPEHIKQAEAIFKEQIEWAVEYDADFILAETFPEIGEALLALESIKKYGKGRPAVINISAIAGNKTLDGVPFTDACRQLEEAGAAAVGLNCFRGPATMLPLLRDIRRVCKGPIAALPVPYRTSRDFPTMLSLIDPFTGKRAFPDVSSQLCGVAEITAFAKECKEIGVQVIGVCCGNTPAMTRAVAEVYGRTPPASKFSPFMEKHFIFGKDKSDYFSDDYYLSNLSAAVSKAP